jgi:hypothetical protein
VSKSAQRREATCQNAGLRINQGAVEIEKNRARRGHGFSIVIEAKRVNVRLIRSPLWVLNSHRWMSCLCPLLQADIGLRGMRSDVAFFVAATSNSLHSFTNHSKVDHADQIRTERLGGAHCGHRLSQSTDVRSKRHDPA